jgi:hypothetical protein
MPLIEPKRYVIWEQGGNLFADVPPLKERNCQVRYAGGEWKDGCWQFTGPQNQLESAAMLLELFPSAEWRGKAALNAAYYWRKVARGELVAYEEIGYALSPSDIANDILPRDVLEKYGRTIYRWLYGEQTPEEALSCGPIDHRRVEVTP